MKYALVIGNDKYDKDAKLSRLQTSAKDARALAKALSDENIGGFQTDLLVNKTEAEIRQSIGNFLLDKQTDDLVLIYFSGHGVLDSRGRLFLTFRNTWTNNLPGTAIQSKFITDVMDDCRSKRQILILDCCHSGAFDREGKKAGIEKAITQATFEGNGYGRVVLTASDSIQFALEGNQVIDQTKFSLFTHYLLEGLESGKADINQDGLISLDEWYEYAYSGVRSSTSQQTPQKWSYHQQGDLYIGKSKLTKKKGYERLVGFPKPALSQTSSSQGIAPDKITLSNGIEFMHVPKGEFLMGSKDKAKFAVNNEKPQYLIHIPYDYWMARYPITNDLYNAYITANKLEHPVKGWSAKTKHPIVKVSWHDAMNYSKWLNSIFREEIPSNLILRLPTEAEWEKSARGTNGQEFPWGNSFEKNKCNISPGDIVNDTIIFFKGTTPVGQYSPQGDSPYGCGDMSGNVWEWTHSLYRPYPYMVDDGRENEKVAGPHVLRGASYANLYFAARCAARIADSAIFSITKFRNGIGFRVCLAPPLPH